MGGPDSTQNRGDATGGSTDRVTTRRQRQITTRTRVAGKNGKMPWGLGKAAAVVGLPVLALAALGGTAWGVPAIESDLESRAVADLRDAGIDPTGLDISYSYRTAKVTGTAPDGVSADDIEAAIRAEDGVRSVTADLTEAESTTPAASAPDVEPEPEEEPAPAPGPTEVQAAVTAGNATTADKIVLSGVVLTEAQRTTLLDAAIASVGAANVTDNLEVSNLTAATPGADDRVASLAAVLAQSGGAAFNASLSDTILSVSGTAPSADQTIALIAAAEGATGVGEATADISVDPVAVLAAETAALQAELDALAIEISETVRFSNGSSTLRDSAKATLDKVVVAMGVYELPVVSVIGHTSSVGPEGGNQRLSQERSEVVVQYLADQGISPARLQAEGKGESEPVVSNDTSAGRAQNRRTEFQAKANFE